MSGFKKTGIATFAVFLCAAVFVYFKQTPTRAEPVGTDSAVASDNPPAHYAASSRLSTLPEPDPAPEPVELADSDTPSDVILALFNAPFNQSPSALNPETNWRLVLSRSIEDGDDSLYSKVFRRRGPAMEIKLFSYAVPSLTEDKELLLSGEALICLPVDKAAMSGLPEPDWESMAVPPESLLKEWQDKLARIIGRR